MDGISDREADDSRGLHVDEVAVDGLPSPASVVREPSVRDLPGGYQYGVTRFADLILRDAFPERFNDLKSVLEDFRIDVTEMTRGGGSRSTIASRFDGMLQARGWGKRNITISKLIDDRLIHATRGHEIDMFADGSSDEPYPGIAIEMEWNNKDPFFDRDLLNFMALHREGALAVGIIITRGPKLQRIIGPTIKTSANQNSLKFGTSTTHWNKLVPRLNLGGGGECPIIVIGIEPERVDGFEFIQDAYDKHERIW